MGTPDFTIAEFLAWVRTKPAGETYNFCDAAHCALGQFLRETRNLSTLDCYTQDIYFKGGIEHTPLGIALCDCQTFGELAQRVAPLLPAEPVSDTWTKPDAYLAEIESLDA
jgi:hypothetical protein